jgi:cytochrome c biogenesis protein CcmG, thiol:disulfide interchange protein DsbE
LSRPSLVALPLLCLLICCGSDEQPEQTGLAHTPVALDWPGTAAALAQLEGQPYLLNFWATWCAPCIAELPELIEVAEEFEAQGLQLVTINYDLMTPGVDPAEMLSSLAEFQAARSLHYPVLVYDGDDYDAIDQALQLPGPIPVTIAFDATGKEVARTESATDAAGFRTLALAALGQSDTR